MDILGGIALSFFTIGLLMGMLIATLFQDTDCNNYTQKEYNDNEVPVRCLIDEQ